MVLLTLPLGLA